VVVVVRIVVEAVVMVDDDAAAAAADAAAVASLDLYYSWRRSFLISHFYPPSIHFDFNLELSWNSVV